MAVLPLWQAYSYISYSLSSFNGNAAAHALITTSAVRVMRRFCVVGLSGGEPGTSALVMPVWGFTRAGSPGSADSSCHRRLPPPREFAAPIQEIADRRSKPRFPRDPWSVRDADAGNPGDYATADSAFAGGERQHLGVRHGGIRISRVH